MKSRAGEDQSVLPFNNAAEPGVAAAPKSPKPAVAIPPPVEEPTRIPKVYSYPGIVSLNGSPVAERIVEIGEWEFLFNSPSTSRQLGTVVLRPMHLRVLFAVCALAREEYQEVDDALDFFWMPPVFDTKWMFGPKDIFTFNCSMRALWRRMGNQGAPSTENSKLVSGCLDDWKNSPIRVRPIKSKRADDSWLARFVIHGWAQDAKIERSSANGIVRKVQPSGLSISVSKNLLFLIERQYAQVHLDVFNGFSSDLGRMIYLHYVPRAAGKEEWSKRLPAVYEELGLPCPRYASTQEEPFRRRWRSQKSVLDQLDGAPTLRGTLCADIERCEDGVPKLVLRVAEPESKTEEPAAEPGALKSIWLSAGGTEAEWDRRLKGRKTLHVAEDHFDADAYVAQKWPEMGIATFEQYRDPIEMGIALIGMDRFREIVGHIASDPKPPTKTRLHQLVYEIKEAIRKVPKA